MSDFKNHLRRQIRYIKSSCDLYDQGNVEEAIRIAVPLRVLFHRTKSSHSLLQHLNSESISLLSTATPFYEDSAFPNLYLVEQVCNMDLNDLRCYSTPVLGNSIRKEPVSYETWWNEPIIEHKQPSSVMTRKDLVLAAANKDGGAHVDKKLDPIYDFARLGAGLTMEFVFKPEFNRKTARLIFENIPYSSLRQIGYEVLNSPELIALQEN